MSYNGFGKGNKLHPRLAIASAAGIKCVDFTGVSFSTASVDHLDPLTIVSMLPGLVIACDDLVS